MKIQGGLQKNCYGSYHTPKFDKNKSKKGELSSARRKVRPFFVYRVKFKFSVKRRNPNASPTGKMQFGLSSFVFCCRKRYSPESLAAQWIQGFAQLVFLFFCAFFKPFPNPHIDILTKPCANRIGKKGHASAQPSFLLQSYDLLI